MELYSYGRYWFGLLEVSGYPCVKRRGTTRIVFLLLSNDGISLCTCYASQKQIGIVFAGP